MTSSAFHRGVHYEYQLGPLLLIAQLWISDHDGGHYHAFVRVFGQWNRFDDWDIEAVNESGALGENFPDPAASNQTAGILLCVLNTSKRAILSRNNSSTTAFFLSS
jgi:hypothetical protein